MTKKTQTNRIAKVTTTEDVLTGRGGLALFTRYVTTLGVLSLLNQLFVWRLKIEMPRIIQLAIDTTLTTELYP